MRATGSQTNALDLRHLRYFIAVAEELNFHLAAERVHVDPSPLSRAIRQLEENLDVLLFARTTRTLRLTPAGERLLSDARELFVGLERTRRAVQVIDKNFYVPLRIGIADGLAQPKLSRCLSTWNQLVPRMPLEVHDMLAPELADALRREELDIGISFGVPSEYAIVQELAWNYPLTAVVPVGHELATRRSLSLHEVLAFPTIFCDRQYNPGIRSQVDAIIKKYSIQPVIAGEAASLAGYLTRIAVGLGVGLADTGHMQMMQREDVVSIPLDDQAVKIATHVLHKRQRSELPTTVQQFVAHAKSM